MQKQKAKAILIFLIILVPLGFFYGYFTPSIFKKGISGALMWNTTWGPGEVFISGDVVVLPWVTLTILPGTTIKIDSDHADFSIDRADSNPDDWNTGDPTVDAENGGTTYVKTHNSIICLGNIVCKGTQEDPIKIISDSETPFYTDWSGISVGKSGEFEYTEIGYALYAIYANSGFTRLTVDHCYIHNCWATGIGMFESGDLPNTPIWITNSTVVDCGHEAIDTHSSGNIEISYNFISQSQVGLNLRDDFITVEGHFLNVNAHHNIIVDCNIPILSAGGSNIFVTQSVLQAQQQDASRWTYLGWTMHQMQNPSAIYLESGQSQHLTVTNTIFFDSPKGLICDALGSGAVVQNGYLNFDNVAIQFSVGISAGAGILTENSMFVDKDNFDFHLQPSSLCKNIGNPIDGNPDLGAYGGATAKPNIGWMPI